MELNKNKCPLKTSEKESERNVVYHSWARWLFGTAAFKIDFKSIFDQLNLFRMFWAHYCALSVKLRTINTLVSSHAPRSFSCIVSGHRDGSTMHCNSIYKNFQQTKKSLSLPIKWIELIVQTNMVLIRRRKRQTKMKWVIQEQRMQERERRSRIMLWLFRYSLCVETMRKSCKQRN